jgi:hypothetical protein
MTATKPDKQKVRDYMHGRSQAITPPQTPEQIRRELGWNMIEEERATAQKGST